jgi:hypothetical protein
MTIYYKDDLYIRSIECMIREEGAVCLGCLYEDTRLARMVVQWVGKKIKPPE